MDDLEKLMIERACARLVTAYCHLVDHGEAAKIADLFTEDGIWTSPENTMSGRDAIRQGPQNRPVGRMSRHVCNNLLIDVIDENNARGVVYFTLYRHDGEPERRVSPLDGPAMDRDTFVRTSAGWCFQRRDAAANFIKMIERGAGRVDSGNRRAGTGA